MFATLEIASAASCDYKIQRVPEKNPKILKIPLQISMCQSSSHYRVSRLELAQFIVLHNSTNGKNLMSSNFTVLWTICSQDHSFPRTKSQSMGHSFLAQFSPWTFCSVDNSFRGLFVSQFKLGV